MLLKGRHGAWPRVSQLLIHVGSGGSDEVEGGIMLSPFCPHAGTRFRNSMSGHGPRRTYMLEIGTTWEMMAQSQATDVEFRRLFDEHFAEVRSYCLRRLSVADANDAVSEVFFVAWRKRDDAPAGVKPWLFAIARNVAGNNARFTVRANRLWSRIRAEPVYPAPGPELQVVRNAEDEALLRAVQSLPDKYAQVLRLWAWEWLTTPEIADVVGCSVSAAEKRLSRALMRIRKSLGHADPHAIRRDEREGTQQGAHGSSIVSPPDGGGCTLQERDVRTASPPSMTSSSHCRSSPTTPLLPSNMPSFFSQSAERAAPEAPTFSSSPRPPGPGTEQSSPPTARHLQVFQVSPRTDIADRHSAEFGHRPRRAHHP